MIIGEIYEYQFLGKSAFFVVLSNAHQKKKKKGVKQKQRRKRENL